MAVTPVATTKGGTGANTSSVTISCPSTTAVGDLMIAMVEIRVSTFVRAVGPDSSWVLLGGAAYANSTAGTLSILSKVATSAGAQSFTFSFIGTSTDPDGVVTTASSAALMHVVRNQASSSPLVALTSGGSGTTSTITFPTVTTGESAEYVIRTLGAWQTTTSNEQKTPTWDAAVTVLATAQGLNGTSTGQSFITAASEVGPTPAAAIATRSLSTQNAPAGWARISLGVLAAPSGAPGNTVAPAVTGTAAVGSVLTADTGTWDQTGLTYAHQWQRDGANISGATASTYTVVTGDAGHTLRDVVTATGSGGSTSANSNGVAIPSAPVNTVAPVVTTDGTPATGETITVNTGTWTGTGIVYTYQWYRGTSPISGETANSYTLVVTDEGANISCRVTATNGGGAASAASNVIVPAVTAPISDASFLSYLSGGTGNTDPSVSYGGARGGTLGSTLNGLIGPLLGTVAQAGGTFYRVIYVRNTHTTATAASCQLFLEQQFGGTGLTLSVAVPSQAVNTTVPALASGTTAPSGVTWTSATTSGGGLAFGNLGPGDYRGVYVRLVVAAGTPMTSEVDAVIAVEGSAA